MRIRLLIAAAAVLSLAACSDSSTAPASRPSPGARSAEMSPGPDGTCRTGYIIATRSDGTVVCVRETDGTTSAAAPQSAK